MRLPRRGAHSGRFAGSQQGFSLIELILVITMTGILMTFAIPKTTVTVENTHVNQGVAGMRSLWLAQRRFHMQYGYFAPTLKTLVEKGFAQQNLLEQRDPFRFEVQASGKSKLKIIATRNPSGSWRGRLTLNEMGELGGGVKDGGGHEVRP